MIKRLRKVGNSQALILDKPILELLGLGEDGEVQLTIQDGCLIVAPADPSVVDPEIARAKLEKILSKRSSLLDRLAR